MPRIKKQKLIGLAERLRAAFVQHLKKALRSEDRLESIRALSRVLARFHVITWFQLCRRIRLEPLRTRERAKNAQERTNH
jgi:hypothetical protein